MNDFSGKVYELVSRIPKGRVATYGLIALWTGNPLAARAVGTAMRNCPDNICWHRVVRADGRVVFELQRVLLEHEGVRFLPNGKVDMKHYLVRGDWNEWEPNI